MPWNYEQITFDLNDQELGEARKEYDRAISGHVEMDDYSVDDGDWDPAQEEDTEGSICSSSVQGSSNK